MSSSILSHDELLRSPRSASRTDDPPRRDHRLPHTLITGASGFIGLNLAERLLREGRQVRLFVRKTASVERLRQCGAEIVEGDLHDQAAIQRAVDGTELIFHLAGRTSAFSAEELNRVNGEGTRNLARVCAQQSGKPVFIHVSSIAASGPAKRGQIRIEADPPTPISNYGRSKLEGEKAVAEFAGELPITILRPGIVYGPQNREMLPMFRSIRWMRFHAVVGWRSPAMSLIHVDDTMELMLRAAANGSRLPSPTGDPLDQLTAGNGVYFGSSPEFPDYAELGRMMRDVLDRPRAVIVPMPVALPWVAANVAEMMQRLRGKSETFNCDKIREAQAESWACSGEKASRELGITFKQSLHDGLAATVDWYREHRWL